MIHSLPTILSDAVCTMKVRPCQGEWSDRRPTRTFQVLRELLSEVAAASARLPRVRRTNVPENYLGGGVWVCPGHSMASSVGNGEFPCQFHSWIRDNETI